MIDFSDILIDRPVGFSIGEEHLNIYPMTLGKQLLSSKYFAQLEYDNKKLKIAPELETLKVVAKQKDLVLTIISILTLKTKEEVLNASYVEDRKKLINTLPNEDIATLLIQCLQEDKYDEIIKELHLDREQEFMRKALNIKKDNSLTFNGKSIYGTLIHRACETYGWSFDYVVWGISYLNLRLLLADAPQNVYLSEEERKKVHIPEDREIINASDPKNAARVIEMIKGMY